MTKQSLVYFGMIFYFYRSKTFKGKSIGKILASSFGSKFDSFLVLVHHVVL